MARRTRWSRWSRTFSSDGSFGHLSLANDDLGLRPPHVPHTSCMAEQLAQASVPFADLSLTPPLGRRATIAVHTATAPALTLGPCPSIWLSGRMSGRQPQPSSYANI